MLQFTFSFYIFSAFAFVLVTVFGTQIIFIRRKKNFLPYKKERISLLKENSKSLENNHIVKQYLNAIKNVEKVMAIYILVGIVSVVGSKIYLSKNDSSLSFRDLSTEIQNYHLPVTSNFNKIEDSIICTLGDIFNFDGVDIPKGSTLVFNHNELRLITLNHFIIVNSKKIQAGTSLVVSDNKIIWD